MRGLLNLPLSPCERGRLARSASGVRGVLHLTTPLTLPLRGPLPLPQWGEGH